MPKQSNADKMRYAAYNGIVKDVKQLLEAGVDVDLCDDQKNTPLLSAADQGRLKVVELLLQHGPDVNASNQYGHTPLTQACENGNDRIVELLLEHGAEVNPKSPAIDPLSMPIANAVRGKGPKRLRIVELLIAAGAKLDLVNKHGVCLLQWAATSTSPEVCKALIDAGLSPDGHDGQCGPLMHAISYGVAENVQQLVASGATIDMPVEEDPGEEKVTPLQYAKQMRKRKVIDILEAALSGQITGKKAGTPAKAAKTSKTTKSKKKTKAKADIASSWKRIEAWLKDHAPDTRKSLKPKAADKQLASAQKRLGYKFPKELITFYKTHNGQKMDADCLVPADDVSDVGYVLMSLAEGLSEWDAWNTVAESGQFEGASADNARGIRAKLWHDGWLPIASNGGGDSLCVDLDPLKSGKLGQVISVCHETHERLLVAKTLDQWLSDLAEALELGDWVPE